MVVDRGCGGAVLLPIGAAVPTYRSISVTGCSVAPAHNGVARAPRTFRPAMRAWAARPISVVRQFGRERRSRRGQEGRPAVRLRAQGSEPEHQAREEHAQANGDVHAPHVAMIGAHPGGDTRTAARGALGGLGWRA